MSKLSHFLFQWSWNISRSAAHIRLTVYHCKKLNALQLKLPENYNSRFPPLSAKSTFLIIVFYLFLKCCMHAISFNFLHTVSSVSANLILLRAHTTSFIFTSTGLALLKMTTISFAQFDLKWPAEGVNERWAWSDGNSNRIKSSFEWFVSVNDICRFSFR